MMNIFSILIILGNRIVSFSALIPQQRNTLLTPKQRMASSLTCSGWGAGSLATSLTCSDPNSTHIISRFSELLSTEARQDV